MYSINMTNINQNNEIEPTNKEINLLQDLLKKKPEKSKNQFQNGSIQIGRLQVKWGQRTNLCKTKKIQNILKNILQNKIKHIEKNINLLRNTLAYVKKERDCLKKD